MWENETRGNLTLLTRQSVGNYTYTVTVAENETRGGLYWLGVNCYFQYLGGTVGFGKADLAFYDSWLHKTELTTEAFTGEIYVTDLDGEPVVNAEVTVRYLYETDVEPRGVYRVSDWVNGTTDEAGRMGLEFQFENLDTHEEVELRIYVNSTYQEAWEFELQPPPVYPLWDPYEEGLDILPLQGRMVPRDTKVRQEYETYYEGEALKKGEFYVYLIDSSYDVANPGGRNPVLKVSKVTTDEEGKLALNIETPVDCRGLTLNFKIEVTDGVWAKEDEGVVCYLQGDLSIGVEVTSFNIGESANVTVTKSGLTESVVAILFVMPIGSRTSIELFPEEYELLQSPYIDWARLERIQNLEEGSYRELENGSANLSAPLPGFFPADDNYLVLVGIITEDDVIFNYLVVDAEGHNVIVEEGGGEDGFLAAPSALAAFTGLGAAALIRRRRD